MQTWESQRLVQPLRGARHVRMACGEQCLDSGVFVLACEGNSPMELVIWKITVQIRSSDYG